MTGAAHKIISNEKLESASSVLRAFAHPLRIKLLSYIHEQGNINVNKIYNTLSLEQSITSQHLRILRDAGLVITTRTGKFVYYTLNYNKIAHISHTVQNFLATK